MMFHRRLLKSTPRENLHEPKLKSAIVVSAAISRAITTITILSGCNQQEAVPVATSTRPMSPAPPTTVGTEIDDTIVTSRVKASLVAAQEVKEFDIKVETRKGVVLLSGFVDSQVRLDRVIADTRAVTGVKGVENGMTLKEGKQPSAIAWMTVSSRHA